MNQKKLKLNELVIKSFTTSLDFEKDNTHKVLGGSPRPPLDSLLCDASGAPCKPPKDETETYIL